jgi:hypothetical protein
MAYSGSTAASTVANPPKRISMGGLTARNLRESTSVDEGCQLWFYNSSHLTTDLAASSFISDAAKLGMRNGDILLAVQASTGGSTTTAFAIGVIEFDSTNAASLTTACALTST